MVPIEDAPADVPIEKVPVEDAPADVPIEDAAVDVPIEKVEKEVTKVLVPSWSDIVLTKSKVVKPKVVKPKYRKPDLIGKRTMTHGKVVQRLNLVALIG